MLGEGKTARDIAAALHISVEAVEAHREHIKQKLSLKNSSELLRFAIESRLRDDARRAPRARPARRPPFRIGRSPTSLGLAVTAKSALPPIVASARRDNTTNEVGDGTRER